MKRNQHLKYKNIFFKDFQWKSSFKWAYHYFKKKYKKNFSLKMNSYKQEVFLLF